MRAVADAFGAAGYHVELPRLPGHGTTLDDLRTTGWSDWAGRRRGRATSASPPAPTASSCRALDGRLARAADRARPSRGRAASCSSTRRRSDQPDDVRAMLAETLEAGIEVVPRHGSDIAQPGNEELNYEGTPLRQLLSLLDDGLVPMAGALRRADDAAAAVHVAPGPRRRPRRERVPRRDYGGPVDHRWLERSYHVATQDYDRDDIIAAALDVRRARDVQRDRPRQHPQPGEQRRPHRPARRSTPTG